MVQNGEIYQLRLEKYTRSDIHPQHHLIPPLQPKGTKFKKNQLNSQNQQICLQEFFSQSNLFVMKKLIKLGIHESQVLIKFNFDSNSNIQMKISKAFWTKTLGLSVVCTCRISIISFWRK
jgi:hypothetical protein